MRFLHQLFLFVLFSWPMLLIGQERTSGPEWFFGTLHEEFYLDQTYSHMFYARDTTVNGVTGQVFQRNFYNANDDLVNTWYFTYLRTDTVVYRLIGDTFATAFDYRTAVGESFNSYFAWRRPDNDILLSWLITIQSIDTIYSNNQLFQRFVYKTITDSNLFYYRDIGGHRGIEPLREYDSLYFHQDNHYLRCYNEGAKVFINPNPMGAWNKNKPCDYIFLDHYLYAEETTIDFTEIKIYPNPNKGKFTIEWRNDADIPPDLSFKLIDLKGTVVFEQRLDELISLIALPHSLTGVFQCIVQTGQESIYRQSIIINE